MITRCKLWMGTLVNPDLAKDYGFSKETIQYLEWTGFLISLILFTFRCTLEYQYRFGFNGLAITVCCNLIIFTVAVSHENRINNLTKTAIIQRMFIFASTIISIRILYGTSDILLFYIFFTLSMYYVIQVRLIQNVPLFSFSSLQHFNLIFSGVTLVCYYIIMNIIQSSKQNFIFIFFKICFKSMFFIGFCLLIYVFCWLFGNNLRMRRYFIAADACKYGDIGTIKAMKRYGLFLSNHLQTISNNIETRIPLSEFRNFDIMENLDFHRDIGFIQELALFQAIAYGHLEVTKFLIGEYHLDNKDFKRDFDLKLACTRGHLEIVRYLLEIRLNNGFDLNHYLGVRLGFSAASHGYEDILRLLVDNKAFLGDHFISVASRNGHLGVIKYLYEQGLSLQIEDRNGTTCIIHAAAGGHLECIVWMLNNGSSLFEKNQKGITCETILKNKNLFQKLNSIMRTKSSKK